MWECIIILLYKNIKFCGYSFEVDVGVCYYCCLYEYQVMWNLMFPLICGLCDVDYYNICIFKEYEYKLYVWVI